jgi:hypothetical protein
VLTGLLFNSVRSRSFVKLLDKENKANSRQALERRIRKTIKSPRLRKKTDRNRKIKLSVYKIVQAYVPNYIKFLRTEN